MLKLQCHTCHRGVSPHEEEAVRQSRQGLSVFVQDALGAARHVRFESCSDHIGAILGPDVMKSVMFLLPDILKSVPLLLYQGLPNEDCGPMIEMTLSVHEHWLAFLPKPLWHFM